MKKVDYIIVGCGLAGVSFCEQLKANNKTFVVYDDKSQLSSTVAGGLYNPVVLKRFTAVWKSEEQLALALPMYNAIEKELHIKIDYKVPVYRKFASLEEQNDWFAASDKPRLSSYLSTKLIPNTNSFLNANYGFGEVLGTGRLDVATLINAYKKDLKSKNRLKEEAFLYENLVTNLEGVQYNNISAKHIVFCEGFGYKKNIYFDNFPLVATKGELLKIHAPLLKIDYVVKGPVFIIPLQDDIYYVGATYNSKDTTPGVTEEAKMSLLEKLDTMINTSFTIVDQRAGIRPTVKDRRPLVGLHPKHNNMYVLNGLGTRGVMIAPYIAKKLYAFIEEGAALDPEIDIRRFKVFKNK